MNATPLLFLISQALQKSKLEAIMIGNAAAALLGAPVTTLDFDFMFRDTAQNRGKLKKFSKELGAVILRPYYPVSALFRVINDEIGLQVDFMPKIHGVKSFASLRSRAKELRFENFDIMVADLGDIINSKKVAGRSKDKAVIEVLTRTYERQEKKKK